MISHWVEDGSGTPRWAWRPSRWLKGNPLPYLSEQSDHGHGNCVVFLIASLFWQRGGENLPAEIAA